MGIELWLVFLLAVIGMSFAPGPSGLLVLTHGARFGFGPTIWTAFGGGLGFLVLIAVSLAGMGTLLAASERAFTMVKWIGALYLVYLGVQVWRAPPPSIPQDRTRSAQIPARSRLLLEGFAVAVSNPKGLIFIAAFLPQFMSASSSFAENLVILGGTFFVVEVGYQLGLARLAQGMGPWLGRHGRWFNRVTGGTFVGLGAALTTTGR